MPVIYQSGVFPGEGSQLGIGDVLQSLFFSPKAPTKSGDGFRYYFDTPDNGPDWGGRFVFTLLYPKR